MSVHDFHCSHDWRVQFSGETQSYYLFDAENKIIAVFPREGRTFEFFNQYVKFCVGHMEVVFFYEKTFKKLYRQMAGHNRKRKIWNRVEKFELR